MADPFTCPLKTASDGATFLVRLNMRKIVKYVTANKVKKEYAHAKDLRVKYKLVLDDFFKEHAKLRKLVNATPFGPGGYAALITRLIKNGA